MLEVGPGAADEDDVVLRDEVDEHGEDFHLKPLDLRPLEDRQPVALHSGFNFADAHVPSGIEMAPIRRSASHGAGKEQDNEQRGGEG